MNIVVLGKYNCRWCDKVTDLIEAKGLTYFGINVENSRGVSDFLTESGLTTVPQVYINGERIGGYEETVRYFEERSH